MDGIKSILLAVIFIAFGIVYVVSPLDLLPGLPIDDIAVAITTTVTSIREIKKRPITNTDDWKPNSYNICDINCYNNNL